MSQIAQFVPKDYKRYIEPFCGGAALFFHLQPKNAVLSDTNPDLITALTMVRDKPDRLIAKLEGLTNSEQDYYDVRDWKAKSDVDVAARFLYLTRLAFNGIYRVNLKGEFNVPYGYKTKLSVFSREDLVASSTALQATRLECADFRKLPVRIGEGDVLYIDPPYVVNHNNNGFTKYNEHLFKWEDQVELARKAKVYVDCGATVLVSNAAHREIRALYPTFEVRYFDRFTSVSGKAVGRSVIREMLLIGAP